MGGHNRRQKVFTRGLYVRAGSHDILKIYKKSTDLWCFIFHFGGASSFVRGSKPTEDPVATGLDIIFWIPKANFREGGVYFTQAIQTLFR